MATKKPAASTRKSAKKPAPSVKKTTVTKVTSTAKVAKVAPAASASATALGSRFKFSRAPLLGASVAEFIGTFLLASVVLAAQGQPLFVFFGLVTIVLAIGTVSGAYVNPALTIGALATKRISLARAASYIVAQSLGALLALVVLSGFIGAAPEVSQEAAAYGQAAPTLFTAAAIPEAKEWVVLAAELLGSVVFAFGVASASRQKSSISKAFVVGGSLYVGILLAGTAANYIGASSILNPAVAGALQALKFEMWPLMIYVLTPLVGAVIGFALSDLVEAETKTSTVEVV